MAESMAPRAGADPLPPDRPPAACGPAAADTAPERRVSADRRARPTRFWDSLRGRRRRVGGRRAAEREDHYVDRYPQHDVMLVIAIFVLNLFDAVFTLMWIGRGGAEGNPLMDLALRAGPHVFLFQKCFVAGAWLMILLVHRNFRIARVGLRALFAVYLLLGLYHMFLHLFAEPITGPAGVPPVGG